MQNRINTEQLAEFENNLKRIGSLINDSATESSKVFLNLPNSGLGGNEKIESALNDISLKITKIQEEWNSMQDNIERDLMLIRNIQEENIEAATMDLS